jgi:uncharacterized protein
MTAYYLDASAVIKRYADESGSAFVSEILEPADRHDLHMSDVGAVEVIASLARRGRDGVRVAPDFEAAIRHFQNDFAGRWIEVRTTPALLLAARRLAVQHFLRGYDAVHLAAAIEAEATSRFAHDAEFLAVSSDTLLNAAARAEGLRVVDPTQTAELR